ncbi:hypothetical protein [Mycoplasma procyoni]|uniref:hypothetical protein n=1 Tax=Mycoplasma procyoni TaxID=568784 RepID=UPI00197C55D5|nr:hypothetical protein [Mycoplasma procyoni]MBN3534375.1 hypothetical protein [Mycoplasma procyoni]
MSNKKTQKNFNYLIHKLKSYVAYLFIIVSVLTFCVIVFKELTIYLKELDIKIIYDTLDYNELIFR